MREFRIAAIPADGIGKEVIAAGLEVLRVVETRDGGFRLAVETFPWGSDYYRKHGRMMARASTNMPICARRASCRASRARSPTAGRPISTG